MSKFTIHRRDLIKSTALAMVWAAKNAVGKEPCEETVARYPGPFYPVEPIPGLVDLTAVQQGRARGSLLALGGRVLDPNCEPLAGAKVEVWQADQDGRYKHPEQTGNSPLDPNFAYFAYAETDAAGRYQFKTIVPGPYRVGDFLRAPHIHFALKHPDFETHITELYFEQDIGFQRDDRVFQGIPKEKRHTLVKQMRKPKEAKGWHELTFDVRLAGR